MNTTIAQIETPVRGRLVEQLFVTEVAPSIVRMRVREVDNDVVLGTEDVLVDIEQVGHLIEQLSAWHTKALEAEAVRVEARLRG